MNMKTHSIFLFMAVSTFTGIAQDSLSTQVWTLQRCIEHAKQENVGLQRKRVAVQQAQISVADARGKASTPAPSPRKSHRWPSRT